MATRLIRDYGLAILIAVIIALVIRMFVIEVYRVPNNSMMPTLEPGDTVIVSKSRFGMRIPGGEESLTSYDPPSYGEVVLFSPSENDPTDYLRRIVAMGDDPVEMKAGKLTVRGIALEQPRADNSPCGEELNEKVRYRVCWQAPFPPDIAPMRVPRGHVMVMNDFRSLPADKKSRVWQIVPYGRLRGKAMWIWLSIHPPELASGSWFSRFRTDRIFEPVK